MKNKAFEFDLSSSFFSFGSGVFGDSPTFTSKQPAAYVVENQLLGFEDSNLKAQYEGFITKMLVESLHSDIKQIEDPFDAIYLADLKPDHIDVRDINKLEEFSDIIDLSDSIKFNDDWDD